MEQSNNKIFKNIILFPRTTELKEVVVKVKKPIFIKNDTVVYQPQKFKDGTERVVEDLLRNLPGIEVENDGQITYKGRKISKLLLEGDDLFGSNYTVGSRNIDVEMIEEVEAIENYIDNPLLKGIKSSEEVAINLKLIKGKTDFSGNADISYGHKKRHALKATLLSVSKNNKGFSTIQSNNVGQNYSPFDFSSNNLSIESRNNGELISSKIIRDEFFRKYEDDSRSSINNSFYSSFNYLFKVSHQFNLKFNLGYFKDELLQKLNRVNEYKFDSIRFNNTQSNYLTKKPNLYNNSLNFIYKFSKRSSLEYDGILNFNNISTSNNAFNNLIETNTALETKDFFLKQSLFFTTRINNNNVITAHGLYSYSESPQNYSINPGIDFQTQLINTELKDIQYSRFNKKHFGVNIDWLNSNGLGKFELSTGVSIIENKLKSFILEKENNFDYILLNDSLNNNFKYNLFKTYFKGAFNYKIDKWTIRPSIMINNFYGSFKNNIPYDFNVKTITKKFYFKPSLRIAYKTGDFSVLFASYSRNNSDPNEINLFEGLIINSYNNVTRNILNFQFEKGNDFLIGYTQNDFYNLFRLNIFFSHSNYKNSRFSKSNIDRDIIFNSKFLLEEGNSNYNFSLSMSKYVNFLRVTFALSSNYSINKYKNIINNSILRDNRNDFWSNQLFLKTSFKGKVNFENRVFLKTNSIFSERKNVNSYTVIQNKSNLLCEITEKCLFSLDMDYTAPNKFTQENIFLDAKIIFNSNKKIIYTLIAQNITNNDMMENIFVTDYFQSKEAYSLLKRYILLSVNFRF